MNKVAEKFMDSLYMQYRADRDVLRAAMEWAYRDAARIAGDTVCDTHIPTGVKIYGSRARDAIMARLK